MYMWKGDAYAYHDGKQASPRNESRVSVATIRVSLDNVVYSLILNFSLMAPFSWERAAQ